jgi:hypothetical protein
MLSVDGVKIFINESTGKFYTFNGAKIGLVRLQALYLFVDNEQRAFFRKFSNKVDVLIKQLNHE